MIKQTNLVKEQKDLTTMVDCINSLTKKGFVENFKAREDGLQSLASKRIYMPDEIKILDYYRFEGNSDPEDNSILYAIETVDGKKGTLVDAYGPYADSNVSKFVNKVESITKKN